MRCITAAAEKDGKLHAEDEAVNTCSQGFLQKLAVDQLMRKFLVFLYNPEVHDRVHNSLSFDPIFDHLNPVHIKYIYIYIHIHTHTHIYIYIYTECPGRNVPDLGECSLS